MQKNFHIGKFFERARRRSLHLDITTRAIGVERSFLLWAPDIAYRLGMLSFQQTTRNPQINTYLSV